MLTDLITGLLTGPNRSEKTQREYCRHTDDDCDFSCVGLVGKIVKVRLPKEKWDEFVKEKCPGYFNGRWK
jgi:hypothetical protein